MMNNIDIEVKVRKHSFIHFVVVTIQRYIDIKFLSDSFHNKNKMTYVFDDVDP